MLRRPVCGMSARSHLPVCRGAPSSLMLLPQSILDACAAVASVSLADTEPRSVTKSVDSIPEVPQLVLVRRYFETVAWPHETERRPAPLCFMLHHWHSAISTSLVGCVVVSDPLPRPPPAFVFVKVA